MEKIFKLVLNKIPRPFLIKISIIIRPIIDWWYNDANGNFTDPINNKNYKKFLPYGYVNQRDNALSPGTLSLERHRMLWLFLDRKTSFFKNKLKVLHIAPEQCFFKRFKSMKNLDYTTLDLHSPIVDIKADITDLPIKDNTYDFIICNHVFEHIEDDEKAMSELYRVLKPGGKGIFQVPLEEERDKTYEDSSIIKPEDRMVHFGQYDHFRIYGMDYFTRLKRVGFKTEAIKFLDFLKEEEVVRFSLSNEIIPFCEKL